MNEPKEAEVPLVYRIGLDYSDYIASVFADRCALLHLETRLYEVHAYEVVSGLLARQTTLSTHLALNPGAWTPHLAPLILRAMTDLHITFAWILKDLVPRAN